ncbi:hypothetical protein AB1Y20_001043 [Prymnesium parvum]|uniref:HIG1 domain-containing protein n=1 Tax=Prymnesium parvum TaxID=97485 RepID=A0AB34KCE9_PRYPA|mmetsp:Transcript_14939/g.37267  ORF Transcript_14939/g.37267 Transcript_14939/m.37267 type:complete len:231 (+) Transcript_14939:59-751(+)
MLGRLTSLLRPRVNRLAVAAVSLPSSYFMVSECKASEPKDVRSTQKSLSLSQRLSNVVYNHPFKTIIGLVAPSYLAVFIAESVNPRTANMILSQRLIHTRVYGQAIAVITTIGVMSFASMMEKQGGAYRLENGVVTRGEAVSLRHWYSKPAEEQEATERAIAQEYDATHGPSMDLILPLIYAPLLPLVWVGLRNRVPTHQLTKIVMGITGVAFAHAVYIMVGDSSMTVGG